MPPSTVITCPVTNEAASEHRQSTVSATSSGVPRRPTGSISRSRTSAPTTPKSDLYYIHLSWICEYDALTETRWPPFTHLWLHVDGIGDTWDAHKPGGQFYEAGKSYTHCNRYAIEMTPLNQLCHLPLRLDPVMTIRPNLTHKTTLEPLEIPAPGITLLQLLYHVFWELSFFGTPEDRDAEREELQERVRRIDTGEAKLIPLEDIYTALHSLHQVPIA